MESNNSKTVLPEWIVEEMISYLYMNGMIMKQNDLNSVSHIPVSVFPSPIEFYQIAFNKLIDRMSRDQEFLHKSLKEMANEDSFVKNYLDISNKSYNSSKRQNIQLGIFRNDFMIDMYKKFIYQIEINTIASSMGTFSDGLKKFINHFSKKYPQYYSRYFDTESSNLVPLHKENVIDNMADSMFTAVKLFSNDYQNCLIVFIVQEKERNEYDQRSIENLLYEKYNLKSRRLTLNEFTKLATLDSNQNIIIESNIVSLVYFRAGYTEKDFVDEECWRAREMIELSSAIKCPNVNLFLCTFKIFQALLLKPEIMRKFIPDELIANDISRFFTKIFYVNNMTDEEKKNVFSEIRADVSKYIVKPQKEGGCNNFYNNDIIKILPENDNVSNLSAELKHSLIMERVTPPDFEAYILYQNKLQKINCVNEISVYGIVLSDEKNIYLNKSVGYLIRTKDKKNQEGGVIVGYSAIDIPYLVNIKLDSIEPLTYKN